MSSDNTCNVRCVFCRDKVLSSPTPEDEFNDKIEKCYLPIFKQAKTVRVGCTGEPFASRQEKVLIQRLLQHNKEVKLNIFTNGILGDFDTLKKYGIYDRISDLYVSIHAATPQTYSKVVRGGNWNKLLNNLQLYSNMFNEKKINSFNFIFVVFSENYMEIPQFLELAKKYNAHAQFWGFRNNTTVELGKNYEQYSIIDKTHPLNENLTSILKNIDWNNENATLFPELQKLI